MFLNNWPKLIRQQEKVRYWLSSRIFQGGAAKNFLGDAPSKFFGANDSRGGGKNFLKKTKFLHQSRN